MMRLSMKHALSLVNDEPAGHGQGDVPLVVLAYAYTASAVERFLLSVRVRPHTTIVSVTTMRIFSRRSDLILLIG